MKILRGKFPNHQPNVGGHGPRHGNGPFMYLDYEDGQFNVLDYTAYGYHMRTDVAGRLDGSGFSHRSKQGHFGDKM